MWRVKESQLPPLRCKWVFSFQAGDVYTRPMINRADILVVDTARSGASLRGLLILIRL